MSKDMKKYLDIVTESKEPEVLNETVIGSVLLGLAGGVYTGIDEVFQAIWRSGVNPANFSPQDWMNIAKGAAPGVLAGAAMGSPFKTGKLVGKTAWKAGKAIANMIKKQGLDKSQDAAKTVAKDQIKKQTKNIDPPRLTSKVKQRNLEPPKLTKRVKQQEIEPPKLTKRVKNKEKTEPVLDTLPKTKFDKDGVPIVRNKVPNKDFQYLEGLEQKLLAPFNKLLKEDNHTYKI